MTSVLRIALVGDHDPSVTAHQAIPRALALAAARTDARVESRWVATDSITSDADIADCEALWCVPASPYRSMEGALRAIRFARVHRRPFLGTCGGFQHALIEYARGVLGWSDAEHAETAPEADRLVVTPLTCAMVETEGVVRFRPGSRLAAAYESIAGTRESREGYHCRYGIAPLMRDALAGGPLRVAAEDDQGDVRAVELDDHPFFVATLFQPERAALRGVLSPVVAAFVQAASEASRPGAVTGAVTTTPATAPTRQ